MGVQAMAELGTPQAKNALITMLDDPVPEVRLAAAERLGFLGETIGEPDVLKVFDRDFSAELKPEDRQRVYVLAALAIGRIKTQKLVELLPQLLENDSRLVRIAAANAVLQLKTTQ
jgi:uncharacterized protein (DUF2336 family)